MKRLFWGNPVLLRELQERVLSRRTVYLITIWVVLLCGITALYYAGEASNTFGNQFDPFGGSVLGIARVGQNMFDWLLFVMMGLVLFLVPGFTAASIAGERERQTMLPMQVTLLRPIDIVVGKIAASVVLVLVLLAITAPILAFAYVIGGITISEVFISLAMLIFSALAIACITVACSAVVRRVPAAIVTAYGVVLALSLGSLLVFGIAGAIDNSRGFDRVNPPLTLLAVNPVVALADVSGSASNNSFSGPDTPMAAIRELLDEVQFDDEFGVARGFAIAEAVAVPGIDVPPEPFPFPVATAAPPVVVMDDDGELIEIEAPDVQLLPQELPRGFGFSDNAEVIEIEVPDNAPAPTPPPGVPAGEIVDVIEVEGPDGQPIVVPRAFVTDGRIEVVAIEGPDGATLYLPMPPDGGLPDASVPDEFVVVLNPEPTPTPFPLGVAEEAMVEIIQEPFPVPIPLPVPPFPDDLVLARQDGVNPNQWAIDRAVPFWAQYVITMATLSAISIWIATRRVRTPAEIER